MTAVRPSPPPRLEPAGDPEPEAQQSCAWILTHRNWGHTAALLKATRWQGNGSGSGRQVIASNIQDQVLTRVPRGQGDAGDGVPAPKGHTACGHCCSECVVGCRGRCLSHPSEPRGGVTLQGLER